MIKTSKQKKIKPIPSKIYTKEYYVGKNKKRSLRGGLEEFESFKRNGKLPFTFQKAVSFVSLHREDTVLDIGCGRGELVCYLAKTGSIAYGIDYATAAIDIAQELRKSLPKSVQSRVKFVKADCVRLPFKDGTFNAVFMIDLVEHLTPGQMRKTLDEAYRVLKFGGKLIIHTNNFWFEKIGKLLIAFSYHWLDVFHQKYVDWEGNMHINYVTKRSLVNALKKARFKAKVEMTVPQSLSEMDGYLRYNNSFLEFIVHHFGYFLVKSPMQYFLSPTLWAYAFKLQIRS